MDGVYINLQITIGHKIYYAKKNNKKRIIIYLFIVVQNKKWESKFLDISSELAAYIWLG